MCWSRAAASPPARRRRSAPIPASARPISARRWGRHATNRFTAIRASDLASPGPPHPGPLPPSGGEGEESEARAVLLPPLPPLAGEGRGEGGLLGLSARR